MKFLLQTTRANPADWEEYESSDWRALTKKVAPTPQDNLDDAPGWCHGINVQGVVLQADHYHVESLPSGGVRVTIINDDPIDWPAGFRHARVWDFETVAPDPALGDAYNTRQTQTVYSENSIKPILEKNAPLENTTFLNWAQFTPPPSDDLMHGKQVTDAHHTKHKTNRGRRGWRTFTEGVPAEDVQDGKVKQNKPNQKYKPNTGTRVYTASDTALANGIHVAFEELALELAPSTPGTVLINIGAGNDELGYSWVTPANEPNSAAWPTGNYRMQLDVTVNEGNNIEYGFLTLGGSAGHFARVNAAIAADLETKVQAEAVFTGTGLKLATTGSVSWAAGSATDRFECLLAVESTAGMGNDDFELELNEADDFVDGPWPGITLLPTPAVATWVVPSPSAHLTVRFAPSPAVATWSVFSPAVVRLRTTFNPSPAVARWVVPSPNVSRGVRGIGGDLIVDDVIEKTIIVQD